MPGDSLLVVVVPPAFSERRGTITIGKDGAGEHVCYDLTAEEELVLAQLVQRKVRGGCGPSFF